MSAEIDEELRAAFATASEFVQPPGTLADRVRAAVRARRRRRTLVATAAVCVALLTTTGVAYWAAGSQRPAATSHHGHPARIALHYGDEVTQLAVDGPYLYVVSSLDETIAAYDRGTGRLVRRVRVPANPSALAVGPGGLVWLAFYADQDGGATGIWLLSPDLAQLSVGPVIATSVVVPTSRTTALVPDQYGLYRVRVPAPGAPGRATYALEAGTSLGPPLNTAPGSWAGLLDGRVVVQVTDGYGLHSHVVIAAEPSLIYQGAAFASTGSALWVVTGAAVTDGSAGPLARLDGELRSTTPTLVQRSALLGQAHQLWISGDTIWVGLGPRTWAAGPSLACFTADASRIGRITALPVRGQVFALAATRDTVYVTTSPADNYGTSYGTGVASYPVPASCR